MQVTRLFSSYPHNDIPDCPVCIQTQSWTKALKHVFKVRNEDQWWSWALKKNWTLSELESKVGLECWLFFVSVGQHWPKRILLVGVLGPPPWSAQWPGHQNKWIPDKPLLLLLPGQIICCIPEISIANAIWLYTMAYIRCSGGRRRTRFSFAWWNEWYVESTACTHLHTTLGMAYFSHNSWIRRRCFCCPRSSCGMAGGTETTCFWNIHFREWFNASQREMRNNKESDFSHTRWKRDIALDRALSNRNQHNLFSFLTRKEMWQEKWH